MQQLRFLFAMALLYMFRVKIPSIIRSTMLYMATGEPAHLWPYTALYSWWWVGFSPETCRVKPLRIKNAVVASCWTYFTTNLVCCLCYLYQWCTVKQISKSPVAFSHKRVFLVCFLRSLTMKTENRIKRLTLISWRVCDEVAVPAWTYWIWNCFIVIR